MNAPFSWWWAALALTLTVAAVAVNRQYSLAVPLAAGAVGVTILAFLESMWRQPSPPARRRTETGRPSTRVRGWLDAGRLGREELVLLLDRLERRAVNPMLPIRPPEEVGALLRLPPEEFRRYLAERVARIEAAS